MRGNKPQIPPGIYGITSRDFGYTHEQTAVYLLKAGVKVIQYREKHADTRIQYKEAKRIKELCIAYGALFIINDRMDIALAVDADGIHIGQDDMPIEVVKRYMDGKIIGVSVRTEQEAIIAQTNGADYLGAGAVYPTTTKEDALSIGLEGLAKIINATTCPVVAIGGITMDKIPALKGLDLHGMAVISAIAGAPDPERSAKKFIQLFG
ncbi:MAG: thiamine phosphate synthase [Deltaproteobacteria bacterium]|nr:thiamine phosphate synthase [Deltaproteobacteria bacterium]MCL5792158.1 thiamine phosphate synthase [Deltaproteobacteria bacterium]